jgi:serine/threonine-protein kinase
MTAHAGGAHWKKLEDIFHAALELEPSQRTAYLDAACAGDLSLRNEAEQLLSSAEQTWGFLEKRVQSAAEQVTRGTQPIGERFGDYKIIELLGQGGMGQVYLASRADELYEQQVAIKVVQSGSRDLLLRFTVERQILANLVHPNVARLLDAGITSSGSPYLVMEYIRGAPIDRHVESRQLSVPDRLHLFQEVCAAVEYAHRNLVIHRDIKPANILVTGDGVPKLLDFGIAKLLEDNKRANAGLTIEGDRLLTPEFASPEQVRGETVTTATDVYALGVLLYVLLTGGPPFKLADKTPFEAAHIICDQPPTRPSSLASTRGYTASTLRGDLDNIVLKALRKEPDRRYSSVQAFSDDVQRYLDGYPVQASSDAWSYRAKKFVSRHRTAAVISALMAAAILSFAIGATILGNRARRARQISERESEFLASLLAASTPEASRGKPVMVRDLLDQGAKRIDELSSEPEVQAAMLDTIGSSYLSLGLYEQASPILHRAYELRKQVLGEDSLDVASTAMALGTLAESQGNYEEAESFYRKALSIREKRLGNNDPLVGQSLALVGESLYFESKNTEAEQTLRAALPLVAADSEPGASVRNYLALVLEHKGQFDEAVRLLREATDSTLRIEGGDSPNYVTSLHNLAGALSDVGNFTEAEKTETQVLEIRRRVSGTDHPDVGYSLNNLGWFYLEAGDWARAEPYLREGLELNRKTLGENHPRVAGSVNNLARVYHEKGDFASALKLYEQALHILQTSGGAESWAAAKVEENLGLLHLDLRHLDLAEKHATDALALRRKLGGNDSPEVASSLIDVGLVCMARFDLPGAEARFREALTMRQSFLPATHPSVISAQVRLGEVLLQEGKPQEAEQLLRTAVAAAQSSPFPLLPWQRAEGKSALGACEIAIGNSQQGLTLVRESLGGLRSHPQFTIRQQALERSKKIMSAPSDKSSL